jgi:hypothetical protein
MEVHKLWCWTVHLHLKQMSTSQDSIIRNTYEFQTLIVVPLCTKLVPKDIKRTTKKVFWIFRERIGEYNVRHTCHIALWTLFHTDIWRPCLECCKPATLLGPIKIRPAVCKICTEQPILCTKLTSSINCLLYWLRSSVSHILLKNS